MTLWEELKARGLYYQCTNDVDCQKYLETEKAKVYLGVDPTSESIHIGHLIPLIVLCHFGRYGHTPIVLVGGGTARVGDPSGKTEARPLLDDAQLAKNISAIQKQLVDIFNKFDITPIFVNNADWLNNLGYIDFIRDIGRHFSVSRMLSFDTYKTRLETGLSFLEFNYQLLQSYDFLHLYKDYQCHIQIGGADQWANIVAGTDLIRRLHQKEVYGYTLPLVTRADGSKMGKSEKGAIFIDPNITSPYDFYQYLRNTADSDVIKFLKMYTFIDLEKISQLETLQGSELNEAKDLLAYTFTEFIHGTEEADKAKDASKAAFYGAGSTDNMPTYEIQVSSLPTGVLDVYLDCGLCASKAEARRLIEQGGAKINGEKILDIDMKFEKQIFNNNEAMLSAGKKKFMRLLLV